MINFISPLRPLAVLLLALAPLAWGADAPSPGVETKIALEESLERRLKSVLSQIFEADQFIVIVNAEMASKNAAPHSSNQPVGLAVVLPGVPVKESIGERDALSALTMGASQIILSRLSATIIIDTAVTDVNVEVARQVTKELLGLQTERGDSLKIERMKLRRDEVAELLDWRRYLKPPDLWWFLGFLLAGFFAFLLLVSYFGSVRQFLRHSVTAMRQYGDAVEENIKMMHDRRSREMKKEREESAEDPLQVSGSGANGAQSDEGAPFSFIGPGNLRNLSFLIKDASVEDVAVIANYLPPLVANELLNGLSEDRRASVLTRLSEIKPMDPVAVRQIEADLKNRIAFVVGGEERLIPLLDFTDRNGQNMIIDSVADRAPDLADSLKQKSFAVEDLADLDGTALAMVVRRMKMPSLAGILREVSDEIQETLLDKLPEGSGAMLKEEIRLAKPMHPSRLAQERWRLAATVRKLKAEGAIKSPRNGDEAD